MTLFHVDIIVRLNNKLWYQLQGSAKIINSRKNKTFFCWTHEFRLRPDSGPADPLWLLLNLDSDPLDSDSHSDSGPMDLDLDSSPMDSDSHLMDSDLDSGFVDSDSLLDSRVWTHSNTVQRSWPPFYVSPAVL